MDLTVNLYNWSKRVNSNSHPMPDTPNTTTLQGIAREPLNLLAPTIAFDLGKLLIPGADIYNYAWILTEPFNRYYFIDNWTYNGGLWYADMRVDVLATYSTAIGNSENYILRCSNENGYDLDIIDSTYPIAAGTYEKSVTLNNPWQYKNDEPCYLLGIIGDDSTTMHRGSVSYYVLTQTQLDAFMRTLLAENPDWISFKDSEISATLAKMIFDPVSYIQSCQWLPSFQFLIDNDIIESTVSDRIVYGWWSIATSCFHLKRATAVTYMTWDVEIPRSDVNAILPYTKSSLYNKYVLHVPPWGDITLDADLLYYMQAIHVSVAIDPATWDATLRVQDLGNNYQTLARYDGRIGIDVPIAAVAYRARSANDFMTYAAINAGSQLLGYASDDAKSESGRTIDFDAVVKDMPVYKNYQGSLNEAIDTIRGKTNSFKNGLINTAKNIAQIAQASNLTVSSSGCVGASYAYYGNMYLRLEYKIPVSHNIDTYGYPAQVTKRIADIPGFIKTAYPFGIEIPTATKAELDMIIEQMMAGFYYNEAQG